MEVGFVCIGTADNLLGYSRYLTEAVVIPSTLIGTMSGIGMVGDFLRRFEATGILCIDEKISAWLNEFRGELPGDCDIWLPPNDDWTEPLVG